MKPILMLASGIVTLALFSYSVGTLTLHRRSVLSKKVLHFLQAGLLFDILGTVLMIAGSTNTPLSFHGVIGYSGLLAMIIDNVLLRNAYRRDPSGQSLALGLKRYSLAAYGWWVLVYLAGAAMAMK